MNKHMQREILGIDIGKTIVDTSTDEKKPFPKVLEVIKRLVNEKFGPENTFIVSRVNEEQKTRALGWLKRMKFHELTGIPEDHIYWCAERHEKAPICQRLGVTAFVDDRPEVLSHMRGIVNRRILFQGVESDVLLFQEQNSDVIRVSSWSEIEKLFLLDL